MQLIRGDKLTVAQKEHVKRAYIYRLTIENGYPEKNPCNVRVPAITDEQWLKEHAFYITKSGELSAKHKHCEPAFMADEEDK